MPRTDPWWTCGNCGLHLAKTKTKGVRRMMFEHRTTCSGGTLAGFRIVQVRQGYGGLAKTC